MTPDFNSTVVPDAAIYTNYKNFVDLFHSKMIQAGLPQVVQGNDYVLTDATGPAISFSNNYYNPNPEYLTDGSTSNSYNFTSGTLPIVILHDQGSSPTFRLGSVNLWQRNNDYYARNVSIHTSPDGVNWTLVNSTSNIPTPITSGFQTFAALAPAVHRYTRITIHEILHAQGSSNSSYQINEIQMFDNSATPVQFTPAPSVTRWRGAQYYNVAGNTNYQQNQIYGTRIYRLNDTLQTVSSGVGLSTFLRVRFGIGTVDPTGARLGLWLSLGNAVNGFGGFPATARFTDEAKVEFGSINTVSAKKCLFVGNGAGGAAPGEGGWFGMSMGHSPNSDSWLVLSMERQPGTTGLTTDEAVHLLAAYKTPNNTNVKKLWWTLTKFGAIPKVRTNWPLDMPYLPEISGRFARSDNSEGVAHYPIVPKTPRVRPHLKRILGAFPTDLSSSEATYEAKVYGQELPYVLLPNVVNSVALPYEDSAGTLQRNSLSGVALSVQN